MELFQARGWSAIISDNLVNRLLSICILVIGLLTGVASTIVSFIFEEAEHSDNGILLPGFLYVNTQFYISNLLFVDCAAPLCVYILCSLTFIKSRCLYILE
mmetsp:Transcript_19967/g.36233  ORF Transcript_19967/g.36233 Transcript_19967/m.36233 type:complete len:101 (+) Transcript_19967:1379-1681(+)